jgi:putative intracellular protease/amidase
MASAVRIIPALHEDARRQAVLRAAGQSSANDDPSPQASRKMKKLIANLLFALVWFSAFPSHAAASATADPAVAAPAGRDIEHIAPYVNRFGRARPVVAVVGENSGTVLSDFMIPFGVLAQSGVAEVVGVATQPGVLELSPLKFRPQGTVDDFDRRFPDGADYVIVPAVAKNDDPKLLGWVAAQAAKGATMVSICNGALVLANAGLTRGHWATAHWSTHEMRTKKYPETHWLKNVRYVADGTIVSSAGITAAMPTSIALVEAIAGKERAAAVASRLGVSDWGTRHNSEVFSLTLMDGVTAARNRILREDIGIPVAAGVDEIKLAWQTEAYTATLRGRVLTVAANSEPVRTAGGMLLLPDRVNGQDKLDWTLPPQDDSPAGSVLDKALADISSKYGPGSARLVVLETEYPWHGK